MRFFRLIGFCGVVVLGVAAAHGEDQPSPLAHVRSFMIQIQGLDESGAIDRLARSDYDLLVVDSTTWTRGFESIGMRGYVDKLRAGKPGRIVLAYFDVGAAESDRSYWQTNWHAASGAQPGDPSFLVAPPLAKWPDTYPVAFWDPAWQRLLFGGDKSVLTGLMRAGFDGVYLDGLDSFENPFVEKAAKQNQVNPAAAMVEMVKRVRTEARRLNPRALVVAQNGAKLIEADPGYTHDIDAVVFEALWFDGAGDVPWDSPKNGDIAPEVAGPGERFRLPRKYQAAGVPVLTIDYCLTGDHARRVYAEAAAHGFIALVTRSSLAQMTTTPPPSPRPRTHD